MSFPNPNNARWRETADAATRAQYPDEYWCVADDGWVQYFWAEQLSPAKSTSPTPASPTHMKKSPAPVRNGAGPSDTS